VTIDAVLLDIEGTTTPLAFVHETLFGFARARLHEFLAEHQSRPDVANTIERLRAEWAEEPDGPPEGGRHGKGRRRHGESPGRQGNGPGRQGNDPEDVAPYVRWLMDRDRKSPGLKVLQGFIWEEGYRAGTLVSEIFPDVVPAIKTWRARGLKVAIYSSGSVLAQQLLFGHTPEGDLTPLFDAFFDTGVGPKISPQSYRSIAEKLGTGTTRLLFVSDTPKELEAAAEAGCLVALCVRPGFTFDQVVIR